jgi:5'-methylthioadenosine phosphorylase
LDERRTGNDGDIMGGWTIGIIGGSGLYALDDLEHIARHDVETPWGNPSDTIVESHIGNTRLLFLPRHGVGHHIPPSEINTRANVDALKRLGATDILAISSVGSLREELPPGRFVVVDQFIDRTVARPPSFFGTGLVAHVSLADPTCPRLSAFVCAAIESAGGEVSTGATYLAMEGPQFSTRAESLVYRQWGADVIGMTAMPEARLAREAELPYVLVGMVTDYDCWREDEACVVATDIVAQMHANAATARRLVRTFAEALPIERTPSPIDTVLDQAILTMPGAWDGVLAAKLDAILARFTTNRAT